MNDDWLDMLEVLLRSEARFLVVGAHALAVYGVPRGTQDLDLWVEPTTENANRVWRALAEFGAPLANLRLSEQDLQQPGLVVQVGLPPNRIDLLTSLTGLPTFDAAWARRSVHAVRSLEVPFLGREDLVINKHATGRLKDLADLEALGDVSPPA